MGIAIATASVLFGAAGAALDEGSLGVRIAVVAGGLAAALVLVVGRGIVENRRLARAANSWPRGKAAFPEYFRWQCSCVRQAFEALAWTALLLAVGGAIISLSDDQTRLLRVILVLLGASLVLAALLAAHAHTWTLWMDRLPLGHRWLRLVRPVRLIRIDQRPDGWFLRQIRHSAWGSTDVEMREFKHENIAVPVEHSGDARVAARAHAAALAQKAGREKTFVRERDIDGRVLDTYNGREGPASAVATYLPRTRQMT